MTLYSLRTDGDQYRITKFNNDGDVESSYLCTEYECECPAGVRPSCRHRQMLPQMLAHKLANTEWFMDWDRGAQIVNFAGQSKRLLDELAASAEPKNLTATEVDQRIADYGGPLPGDGIIMMGLDNLLTVHNTIAEAVGEPLVGPAEEMPTIEASKVTIFPQCTKPWRRM